MSWQPIATAPLDGEEILGWRGDCGVLIIRYCCASDFMTEHEMQRMTPEDTEREDWFCADFVSGSRLQGTEVPTHWMPMPEDPEDQTFYVYEERIDRETVEWIDRLTRSEP